MEPRRRLTQFCQENALVTASSIFQQHKTWLYIWTSPDGQHRNQIDCILCTGRWRSSIQSAKTRWGVDCGSDHELLIAKFRLKLKKVGKTTRPFRYDLNQIPYDYTVEVRNRFPGEQAGYSPKKREGWPTKLFEQNGPFQRRFKTSSKGD